MELLIHGYYRTCIIEITCKVSDLPESRYFAHKWMLILECRPDKTL